MIDLNTHINNYGKPNAIIDFNGIMAFLQEFGGLIKSLNVEMDKRILMVN